VLQNVDDVDKILKKQFGTRNELTEKEKQSTKTIVHNNLPNG